MDRQIIIFSANEQSLIKTGGVDHYAGNIVRYIEAHFDLGANWTGYDSVRAIWRNKRDVTRYSTVLNSEGVCLVPFEVLTMRGDICMNLVGSIVEDDVLVDRLTTYPICALTVDVPAMVDGSDPASITPSEYEQFVAKVANDANRAEAGAESAEASAQSASESAEQATASAQASEASALRASGYASDAQTSERNASEYAQDAHISAQNAETWALDAEEAKRKILSMRAEAETLAEGSQATASYSDGVLTLGIPKGDTGARGEKGETGETGATPNLSIGTVETLEPNDSATASITGTAENPVLNLGLPQGRTGEVTRAELDGAVADLKADIDGRDSIIFDFTSIAVDATSSGWRLNESDGLCSRNTDYKMVKYKVTAGDFVRVECDDRFQFQTVASVPAYGTSNRVGKTYTGNESGVKVPESATYLIVSETIDGTPNVYRGIGINSQLDETNESVARMTDIIGVYGKSEFTVNANTTHSSSNDKAIVTIPQGTNFFVSVIADQSVNVVGTLYAFSASGGTSLGNITLNGSKYTFTAASDIIAVGIYIGSIGYKQSYRLLVEGEESLPEDISDLQSVDVVLRENVFKNADCSFLFFTDVHGSSENVSKIVDYANKFKANLSAVINGGDTVAQYLNDGISWYDTIVADCDIDVLMAVGNHDVWGSALYDKLPAATVYSNYIAPVASSVDDLVQPSNASVDGKCYYYKDYGSKVRVIVLNAMSGADYVKYWDADAKTWFENALADAKTNGKHVICISHCPFTETDRVVNQNSSWTSYSTAFDGMVLEPEAVTAVQNFIDGGGIFIGWLSGHTHRDVLMANSDGQFMFSSATAHFANSYFHVDGWGSVANSDITFDCFNLVGIDTTSKIIKLSRVGWNTDAGMKKRTALSYNYESSEFITDRG